MYNPFRFLSKFEWCLWVLSLLVVTVSFFLGGEGGILSLIASLLGVTALIFVAKGDVTGQMLTVVFSVLYAVISWDLCYYGEMITYLCMSAPIAVFSVVSWLRHPYAKDRSEVKMEHLSRREIVWTVCLTAVVTFVFYWILHALGNAELLVSTISVTTSFLASYLLFRRSPYYALAYAANDVVLIVLWVIAAVQNPSYLSMVACFLMFLCNDLYGFFNWLRVRKQQI
ncbi:MAG: nicotinamide mononucleotide transporter [Clostridia bacterium]|nr:nicotinamide mononucleotide transporter [Clostridia bacterium]